MTDTNRTPAGQWTRTSAVIVAVVCLAAGIAGGWFIRGSQSPAAPGAERIAITSAPMGNQSGPASRPPDSDRLKEMADAEAVPLLDKLKSDPKNPGSLTAIGNIYYDAKQYPIAIDYYGRALKANPSDASVRTDMATAYWYMGNADTAIAEFNKALTYAPNNANTLFNLGLVKWKGKMNATGAIADWEKLLAANPNYEEKDKVEQMIAEAKGHAAGKSGAK